MTDTLNEDDLNLLIESVHTMGIDLNAKRTEIAQRLAKLKSSTVTDLTEEGELIGAIDGFIDMCNQYVQALDESLLILDTEEQKISQTPKLKGVPNGVKEARQELMDGKNSLQEVKVLLVEHNEFVARVGELLTLDQFFTVRQAYDDLKIFTFSRGQDKDRIAASMRAHNELRRCVIKLNEADQLIELLARFFSEKDYSALDPISASIKSHRTFKENLNIGLDDNELLATLKEKGMNHVKELNLFLKSLLEAQDDLLTDEVKTKLNGLIRTDLAAAKAEWSSIQEYAKQSKEMQSICQKLPMNFSVIDFFKLLDEQGEEFTAKLIDTLRHSFEPPFLGLSAINLFITDSIPELNIDQVDKHLKTLILYMLIVRNEDIRVFYSIPTYLHFEHVANWLDPGTLKQLDDLLKSHVNFADQIPFASLWKYMEDNGGLDVLSERLPLMHQYLTLPDTFRENKNLEDFVWNGTAQNLKSTWNEFKTKLDSHEKSRTIKLVLATVAVVASVALFGAGALHLLEQFDLAGYLASGLLQQASAETFAGTFALIGACLASFAVRFMKRVAHEDAPFSDAEVPAFDAEKGHPPSNFAANVKTTTHQPRAGVTGYVLLPDAPGAAST